jgi:hypothetical protein
VTTPNLYNTAEWKERKSTFRPLLAVCYSRTPCSVNSVKKPVVTVSSLKTKNQLRGTCGGLEQKRTMIIDDRWAAAEALDSVLVGCQRLLRQMSWWIQHQMQISNRLQLANWGSGYSLQSMRPQHMDYYKL